MKSKAGNKVNERPKIDLEMTDISINGQATFYFSEPMVQWKDINNVNMTYLNEFKDEFMEFTYITNVPS